MRNCDQGLRLGAHAAKLSTPNQASSSFDKHAHVSPEVTIEHRTQLYTQETDSGNLPNLPETDNSPGLHARSTGRIFALLSLVQQCAAVPGQ